MPSCWLPRHRWGYGGRPPLPTTLGPQPSAAVASSLLRSAAACCSPPPSAVVIGSMLQSCAVICSLLQSSAAWCSHTAVSAVVPAAALPQSVTCGHCSSAPAPLPIMGLLGYGCLSTAVRSLQTLQQHPSLLTNHGTIGALLSQRSLRLSLLQPLLHSVCCRRHSLQPTPAPLPIEGLWGCCTLGLQLRSSSISAVTLMVQLLQPSWCCSTPAAAYCGQPPLRYQSRGYGDAAPCCFCCCALRA